MDKGGDIMTTCPKCGSTDVDIQVMQESTGSVTKTRTVSKYKEKGHGCLWWLLIGWWWWIFDLFLWIFLFLPRLIMRLFAAPFKKKKYEGQSTSTATTKNKVRYRSVCVCKDCGYNWTM